MKEAAGEANMTVITIVLIAVVLGVGGIIVNNLMTSTKKSSACSSAGATWNNGTCYGSCDIGTDGKKTNCSNPLTWNEQTGTYSTGQ